MTKMIAANYEYVDQFQHAVVVFDNGNNLVFMSTSTDGSYVKFNIDETILKLIRETADEAMDELGILEK
jgi:hypothetical protein